MSKEEKSDDVNSRLWILYATIAMLLFASGNVLNAMVAADVGPFTFFYWCIGGLIVCFLQHSYQSIKQYRNGEGFWVELNLMKEGTVRWINVLGFALSCWILFMNVNLVNMCMWTATLAHINVGVIAVVWSMTPLLQALFDMLIFKQKLTNNLWIGMVLMVGACALLTVQPYILNSKGDQKVSNGEEINGQEKVLPAWIPVLFGIVTPFSFTSGNITIKFLNDARYGIEFTSDQLSKNPIMLNNVIGIIAGAIIWSQPVPVQAFHSATFLKGAIGSAIFQLAMHFGVKSMIIGPQGPASAIMVSSTLLLTLIEAIRNAKLPSYIEFICLAFGFFGAVLMAAPELIEKCFQCILCRNKKLKVTKTKSNKTVKIQQTELLEE